MTASWLALVALHTDSAAPVLQQLLAEATFTFG
jgi:hypothetical protein